MSDSGTAGLLIELGCEELPPKALAQLTEAFFEQSCDGLESAGIEFSRSESGFYFTPRRMTLSLARVSAKQADRTQQRKGPSVAAAFDAEGAPTQAALGFARSVNRSVDDLQRLVTDKGEWLACTLHTPGQTLSEVLFPVLESALQALPVPRPMRWSDHNYSFVRPVHWLLVLFGKEVIDGTLFGCQAGRMTQGHRIHAPGPHTIKTAEDYLSVLRKNYVEADQSARRENIRAQAKTAGEELEGQTRITEELLEEVSNLVEWPVAVTCSFDEQFLQVPQEALIASMESHQKFFPVLSAASPTGRPGLTNSFIVIANIESTDPDQMAEGFERVIRPRLADARFFWQQDQETALSEMVKRLDKVVFQKNLGTIGDKCRRLDKLSALIAEEMGIQSDNIRVAASLCKADLNSQMVSEFPELQGITGAHLAREQGQPETVVTAIASHYLPRFSGDDVPADTMGQILAIADRMDTLIGVFAADQRPTGSKDPYALRRASLGIIRILTETRLSLPIDDLIRKSASVLCEQIPVSEECLADVRAFLLERARHYFMDLGASSRQVSAALAAPLTTLKDLAARIDAVKNFMHHEDSEGLIAANKRIGNILKKQDNDFSEQISTDLFVFDEERELYTALEASRKSVHEHIKVQDYDSALSTLSGLREAVDAYFETVMVMDKDPTIRANRLATLALLKRQFDDIADFSVSD